MRSSKEIINLIKSMREKKGLSLEELGRRVGIAKSTLSRYETGQREFPVNDIDKYADVLGTTIEFLLDLPGMSIAETKAVYGTSKQVPFYGSIAAGVPLEMLPIDDYIEIPAGIASQYPNAFLLKIDGDSMNKIVPNGAFALIAPCQEVNNGDVAAVVVNAHDATLKRFYKLQNSIALESDSHNPTFKTHTYSTQEELNNVKIIGKMVWYMSAPNIKY